MQLITKNDIEKLPTHKDIVRFAIFCAEQVLHLTDKPEAKTAVNTARRWLVGEATSEECKVAADAAYTADATAYAAYANAAYAASYAANAAAYATAYTANAAAYAANAASYAAYAVADADKQKIIEEQWNYYNELLCIDEIIEEEVLCGS